MAALFGVLHWSGLVNLAKFMEVAKPLSLHLLPVVLNFTLVSFLPETHKFE